ncbi:hypothetical protein [Actinomadura hibisca]|nr:hypothetical protein [Actinomadura hibisca]
MTNGVTALVVCTDVRDLDDDDFVGDLKHEVLELLDRYRNSGRK